jgi:ABC-type siderophore export system fused ATPase/permease subunit
MSFALLIASLLAGITQNIPQISASIKGIIADIYGSLSAIVSSGVTSNLNPASFLLALSGVIATLKAEPNIPPLVLQMVGGLDDALQAAVAADKVAQLGVDPTQLNPVEPLP